MEDTLSSQMIDLFRELHVVQLASLRIAYSFYLCRKGDWHGGSDTRCSHFEVRRSVCLLHRTPGEKYTSFVDQLRNRGSELVDCSQATIYTTIPSQSLLETVNSCDWEGEFV